MEKIMAIFDPDSASQRLGGDKQLQVHLTRIFLDEMTDYKIRLTVALNSGRPEEFRSALHKIKGAASTVGAVGLYEMAASYDSGAVEVPTLLKAREKLVEDLYRLMESTVTVINHWLVDQS